MPYTVSNQTPAILDPVHLIPIAGDFDPIKALRKTLVKPLFEGVGSATATVQDDQGQNMTKDDVTSVLLHALGETVNVDAEDAMKDLYAQGLIHYSRKSSTPVNEVFTLQAAQSVKPPLPDPGPNTIYTAQSDVQPSAKKLMAGLGSPEEFFASVAYTYAPHTLGFWFQNDAEWAVFVAWFLKEVQALNAVLPTKTQNLLAKFAQYKLDEIVEGVVLRKDDSDGNEEYSFPRVVVHLLMKYQTQANQTGTVPVTGVMPFVASELFVPRVVVLVNLEAHIRATPARIKSEWELVTKSLNSPVRVVSNQALSKLTALPRAAAKAAAAAANASTNRQASKGRTGKVTFRKLPPTKVEIHKGVLRALKRMKEVNRSHNVLRTSKVSYQKANRRDPDDYNRPGRIISHRYLPDIHLFLDTSGSISEANYQESVMMLIRLAKKLNVDIYVSSFSHILSQETLLRTANRSTKQIWREFRRIPKVSGGTDYHQLWDYVNANPERRKRLSLAITDFEWTPPTQRVDHPPNFYYAPCSNMDWGRMQRWAKRFTKGMRHIEPAISRRLIGIFD